MYSKLNGAGLKPKATFILYIGLFSSLSVLTSVIPFFKRASIAFIFSAVAIPFRLNSLITPNPLVHPLYGSDFG